MARILINGLKSKQGGGRNILNNYLKSFVELCVAQEYFVLTPDVEEYRCFESEHLHIIDVSSIFKKNILFPALYFYELPRLLRKLQIDLIFNFGDVIIPSSVKQIYFFDWAYAVYSEKYIWSKMSSRDYLMRKMKVYLIKKYIKDVSLTIVQTNNMAKRLKEQHQISNVVVIPTPAGLDFSESSFKRQFYLPKGKKLFLYPSSYASHKNFDIILQVAQEIEAADLPFQIVLTVNEVALKPFLDEVYRNKINCITNVGIISLEWMPALYRQCDALLFPSLLESFGIPYVEAMIFEKPILTSDIDFAREVCGDVAEYFDPFDPVSVLLAMKEVDKKPDIWERRIESGKKRVANQPSWEEIFLTFQFHINRLVNRS